MPFVPVIRWLSRHHYGSILKRVDETARCPPLVTVTCNSQSPAGKVSVTNSVSFDAANLKGADLDSLNTFGKYSSTLSSPRVMQFGLRFEF